MRRRLNPVTIIGLIMVFTGPAQLLPVFLVGAEDWWTPRRLALDLEGSRDRVRVLVSGRPLAEHLEGGTLQVAAEGETPRPLTPDEVRFRFNNWDRVRADLYFRAIFGASYTTAGVAALLVGLLLVPRLTRRPTPQAEASG